MIYSKENLSTIETISYINMSSILGAIESDSEAEIDYKELLKEKDKKIEQLEHLLEEARQEIKRLKPPEEKTTEFYDNFTVVSRKPANVSEDPLILNNINPENSSMLSSDSPNEKSKTKKEDSLIHEGQVSTKSAHKPSRKNRPVSHTRTRNPSSNSSVKTQSVLNLEFEQPESKTRTIRSKLPLPKPISITRRRRSAPRKLNELTLTRSRRLFSPVTRTPKPLKIRFDFDWAKSSLDLGKISKKVITTSAIEKYLHEIHEGTLPSDEYLPLYYKIVYSFETLEKELGLPQGWIKFPEFSEIYIQQMLKDCSQFIRSRALTVTILHLLHERENKVLELITADRSQQDIAKEYRKVIRLTEDLEQNIAYWKHSGLPYSSFIYLEEDINIKLKEDMLRLSKIFNPKV